MRTTSVSLLERLQVVKADQSDWNRLQEIYLPLIRIWLARIPGLGDEIADLSQDVWVVLIREIPRFRRKRDGSFRAWLRQVTVNRVRTHRKQVRRRAVVGLDAIEGFLDRMCDSSGEMARQWDLEHDRHVFQKLLRIVRPDFGPAAWSAFERFALDGLPAADVAAELGMTENAVLRTKSRILKRLREEAGELLDGISFF